MSLGSEWAIDWVRRSAAAMSEHRMELIHLDRDIGDGDHGENMDRGFQAVLGKLDEVADDAVPADVLKVVATTLISTVGGAAGPLYGTAYLKGSMAVKDAQRLDGEGVAAFLGAACDGVVARGKAAEGDKTMVDAWLPAVAAAREAAATGADAAEVLAAAADAAERGAAATEALVARKGRASYLGERSAGHRDAGAQSSAYLLRAAADAAAGVCDDDPAASA